MTPRPITSRSRFIALAAWWLPTSLAGGPALALAQNDLFISEYVHAATGAVRALEIYNGTGAPIDLSVDNYVLELYFNGGSAPGATIDLGATADPLLLSGDVFVVARNFTGLPDAPDLISTALNYDGDDAIVLRKGGPGGTVVDSLGQVGFDPGLEWGTGNLSTRDNTLRRMAAACRGDVEPFDDFNPTLSVEWDGFPSATYDGLFSHFIECVFAGDCNTNAVLDECDFDCNTNGQPDACEPVPPETADCNSNGTPDACDLFGDLNCDGALDGDDAAAFILAFRDPAAYADAYPGCDRTLTDMDCNGAIDCDDWTLFKQVVTPPRQVRLPPCDGKIRPREWDQRNR